MQKIGYIFFREKFSTRKNYFFSKTFFCVKFHRSAFQCATLYCQRITQTKTAQHQSHQPPLALSLESPSSYDKIEFGMAIIFLESHRKNSFSENIFSKGFHLKLDFQKLFLKVQF